MVTPPAPEITSKRSPRFHHQPWAHLPDFERQRPESPVRCHDHPSGVELLPERPTGVPYRGLKCSAVDSASQCCCDPVPAEMSQTTPMRRLSTRRDRGVAATLPHTPCARVPGMRHMPIYPDPLPGLSFSRAVHRGLERRRRERPLKKTSYVFLRFFFFTSCLPVATIPQHIP